MEFIAGQAFRKIATNQQIIFDSSPPDNRLRKSDCELALVDQHEAYNPMKAYQMNLKNVSPEEEEFMRIGRADIDTANEDIDEIMYRLYVIDKVRKGEEAVKEGNTISVENLKKEIESW